MARFLEPLRIAGLSWLTAPGLALAALRPGAAAAGRIRTGSASDGAPKRLAEALAKRPAVLKLLFTTGEANAGSGVLSTSAEDAFLQAATALAGAAPANFLHAAAGPLFELFPAGERLRALTSLQRQTGEETLPEGAALASSSFPFMLPEGDFRVGAAIFAGEAGSRVFFAAAEIGAAQPVLEAMLPRLWLAGPGALTAEAMPGDALIVAATGAADAALLKTEADLRMPALEAGLRAALTHALLVMKPSADRAFGAGALRVELSGASDAAEAERALAALCARLALWRLRGSCRLAALRESIWSALALQADIATLERTLVDMRIGAAFFFKAGDPQRLAQDEEAQALDAWASGAKALEVRLGRGRAEAAGWC